VGSLAEKRAEFLKQNLERTLLPTLPAGVTPVIEVTPPKIGETEWDKNKGRDHEDYKREQFVRASIQSTKEIPGTPPPPPPPQKTKYAISWTLDNRCDRIKYFPTFQDWDAMVKKLEENPRFTAAYKETRGVPASEAWMKMGYLSGDPTMFEGPFFNNCSQKFEPAMK
jgi:hypothetical protein